MNFPPATTDPRRLLVTLAAAGALLFSAAAVTGSLGSLDVDASATPATASVTASTACPAGEIREQATSLAEFVTSGLVGSCASVLHAEGTELDAANTSLTERATGGETAVKPGAFAAAVATKARIAAASTAPESTAPWTPLGTGAEHADVAGYDQVNGLGLAGLSGRIQSFDHDPANPAHWWAGVSAGGSSRPPTRAPAGTASATPSRPSSSARSPMSRPTAPPRPG